MLFVSYLFFAKKSKNEKCVFFTFNNNLFTASQFATLQSSRLALSHNFLISFSLMNKLVSSANKKTDNKFELSEMALTYITNIKGPKIDPWGTPQVKMELFYLTDL